MASLGRPTCMNLILGKWWGFREGSMHFFVQKADMYMHSMGKYSPIRREYRNAQEKERRRKKSETIN